MIACPAASLTRACNSSRLQLSKHPFSGLRVPCHPRPLLRTFANSSKETISDAPSTSTFKKAIKVVKWTGFICASGVAGVFVIGGAIFLHDAFTYTSKHIDGVPTNPLALHPENGGPKNLPIAKAQVGDDEDEESRKLGSKPKLVIVGGGWGVCYLQLHISLRKLSFTAL